MSSDQSSPRLAKNIADTVSSVDEICYDFKVQIAGPGDNVEDATIAWRAPYETVAKLWIRKADNPVPAIVGRQAFCENLSFNPWRTLEAHRPLGRINRARRTAYLMSSSYRHQVNNVPQVEPTESSWTDIQ